MPSPIDVMVLKNVRCTKCAPYGGCSCWERVTLRCRGCGKTKRALREGTDPAGTAVVDCLCPECDDGGNKPETLYFDKNGQQIQYG